jgi:hypothetical protein
MLIIPCGCLVFFIFWGKESHRKYLRRKGRKNFTTLISTNTIAVIKMCELLHPFPLHSQVPFNLPEAPPSPIISQL